MTDVQQFVAYDAGLDDELQDRLPSHNAPRFQSGLNAVIERRETLMNFLILGAVNLQSLSLRILPLQRAALLARERGFHRLKRYKPLHLLVNAPKVKSECQVRGFRMVNRQRFTARNSTTNGTRR